MNDRMDRLPNERFRSLGRDACKMDRSRNRTRLSVDRWQCTEENASHTMDNSGTWAESERLQLHAVEFVSYVPIVDSDATLWALSRECWTFVFRLRARKVIIGRREWQSNRQQVLFLRVFARKRNLREEQQERTGKTEELEWSTKVAFDTKEEDNGHRRD